MSLKPLGFARRFRLRKRKHFLRTQRRGQRLSSGRVFVFMASHRSSVSRFGFTVSKKVGGAVVRNRVRRRLKEIVRTHRNAFPAQHCYVIVARPEAAIAEFDGLKADLLALAEQAQRKIPRENS